MIRNICILTLIILFAACSPHAHKTIERTATDTVIVNKVLRDTTIMVQRDSSLLRALIECDSVGNARLAELIEYRAGEHLRVPDVRIQGNKLVVKAEVDSFSIAMSYFETHTELMQKETLVQTKIVEVNKLNFMQRALLYIGALALLGIIIYLLIKLKF